MIEIKNIIFAKSEVNFIKCILCFINYILPLRLKYAPESYVAFYENKEESLITLEKDSNSHTRFKITKLFLEENSANIARELANYVITKYRAQGANSFYIASLKNSEFLEAFTGYPDGHGNQCLIVTRKSQNATYQNFCTNIQTGSFVLCNQNCNIH